MLKPFIFIAVVLVLILLVSDAFRGQFSSLPLISTRGNLLSPASIGVYQDPDATRPVSYIDWGSIEPGLTENVTIYIRNEGERKVNLSLDTTDWKPANISNYMNLTWNYSRAALFPSEIAQIELTLSSGASSDLILLLATYDVKEFSFNIVINAIG